MGHRYQCEEARDGEISCVVWNGDFVDGRARLAAGVALQLYSSFTNLKTWTRENFPDAECWYTERNGDGVAILVPKGTPPNQLPSWAMSYCAFEWIDPDKDFGSGVFPRRWRTN